MDIPATDAARRYAEQVLILHLEVTECCRALDAARALSLQAWQGRARDAFDEVYGDCLASAAELERSLGKMHLDALSFAADVGQARFDLATDGLVEAVVDVLTIVDLLQGGLDVATDWATLTLAGGVRAGMHAVGVMLTNAVRDALAATLIRRATLRAAGSVVRYAAPRLVGALVLDEGLRLALGESLDPRDGAGTLAVAALIPGAKGAADELVLRHRIAAILPRGFTLGEHEGPIGHTLAKHVVSSIADLRKRLENDRRSYRSYGFVGEADATAAVTKAFRDNLDAIEAWFASGAPKKDFDALLPPDSVVGGFARKRRGIFQVEATLLVNVRLVLVHEGDEIIIKSAFPTAVRVSEKGAS